MILYKKQKGLYMIKKKCITRCSLSILLFLFSIKSNETILKKIDLQLKAIEKTEKKIESIHNFLGESIKKEKEQKLEKLAGILNKQKNELLKEGLGKIKKEATLSKALQIAIQYGEKNTVNEILKMFPEKIQINKSMLELLEQYNLILEHKILNNKNIDDKKIVVIEKDQLPNVINLESAFQLFTKQPKLLKIKS